MLLYVGLYEKSEYVEWFFSSLNNSETIGVKNSFYLKCVYLMCLVLNSAPCACILVVYVDTHRSNL